MTKAKPRQSTTPNPDTIDLPPGVDKDAAVDAATPPADRTPTDAPEPREGNPQRDEATDGSVTFEWDGEEWTFKPSDGTRLEYLAAIEDADSGYDVTGIVRALRILLGRPQAERLFAGRSTDQVNDFFDACGKAAGTGNF